MRYYYELSVKMNGHEYLADFATENIARSAIDEISKAKILSISEMVVHKRLVYTDTASTVMDFISHLEKTQHP